MSDSAPATETANIHLQVLGKEHVFPVEFPIGEQSVGAMLPVARKISSELTTIALQSVSQDGRTVSCQAGCGACCRQLVAISLVEARSLADVVAAMPPERQPVIRGRFAAAIRRLEEADLLDASEPSGNRMLQATRDEAGVSAVARRYFRQQIACPFLEDESCSIYPERPLVCREYNVTSPATDCSRLYEVPIDTVELPVHMSDVMTRVAHTVSAAPLGSIPLVLALEWSDAHPEIKDRTVDSVKLLQTLLAAIDDNYARSFDHRTAPRET